MIVGVWVSQPVAAPFHCHFTKRHAPADGPYLDLGVVTVPRPGGGGGVIDHHLYACQAVIREWLRAPDSPLGDPVSLLATITSRGFEIERLKAEVERLEAALLAADPVATVRFTTDQVSALAERIAQRILTQRGELAKGPGGRGRANQAKT